jgi:hypothetical protein
MIAMTTSNSIRVKPRRRRRAGGWHDGHRVGVTRLRANMTRSFFFGRREKCGVVVVARNVPVA